MRVLFCSLALKLTPDAIALQPHIILLCLRRLRIQVATGSSPFKDLGSAADRPAAANNGSPAKPKGVAQRAMGSTDIGPTVLEADANGVFLLSSLLLLDALN